MKTEALLEVKGLQTSFETPRGLVRAVDGVSFSIPKGKTLCLVGESGCGKSVTSLSVMRLIPRPPGRIESGEIWFGGRDLLKLSSEEMRKLRGNEISMIFQEPMTSLNPVFTVGDQIGEPLQIHRGMGRSQRRERAIELLKLVGIPAPERRVDDYPHQMSGGMRQRVMIAMALACEPKLLIADEPTTALDVTIQAQILELLRGLQERFGMSILLITHDLGVVAEMAHDVAIMYAGQIVESATVNEVFKNPRMPYTQGLLRSVPRLSAGGERRGRRLESIPGIVPNLLDLPRGCRFQDRCRHVEDKCKQAPVELRGIACQNPDPANDEHSIRCVRDIAFVQGDSP